MSIRDDAVPPQPEVLAEARVVPLDDGDTVEREPRQRVARLARDQVGAGRRGPRPEQLLGGDLVGDVPVEDAAARALREAFAANADVALQLRPLPVRGD